jgi:hypothetical protein
MKPIRTTLDKDIHIRIDEQTQKLISQIARENHLKDSTFARIVLQRTVPNYSRNRFFDAL